MNLAENLKFDDLKKYWIPTVYNCRRSFSLSNKFSPQSPEGPETGVKVCTTKQVSKNRKVITGQ